MSIYKREQFSEFNKRIHDFNAIYSPDVDRQDDEATQERRRKLLLTIHNEFPYGTDLAEQIAYLLRAFAGLTPFGESDFRTGWDYAGGLLEHEEHSLIASGADIDELALQLFDRLGEVYPDGMQRRNVLDRDELLEWLTAWCKAHIS